MDIIASVIIPVFNDKDNLDRCLSSLFDTAFSNFEVIVVDDGSYDSPEPVTQKYHCRLIRLPQNMGQAYARNKAVEVSASDIILFTDADCLVMKDWVKTIADELVKSHKECKEVTAITGRLISEKGFIEMCHAYTGYGYIQTGPRKNMDYLNTACAAIYKEAFLKVKGFSADMRVSEDPELALKLTEQGYRIIFEPSIYVFHHHGIHSLARFIKKHYSWGKAIGSKLDSKHSERAGIFTPLILNSVSNLFLIVPLALVTTLKIVKYNLRYNKKVLLYSFFIFLAKIFFRTGIFLKSLEE